MQRKSRKREAVYEILRNSYDHPTVETVYERARINMPEISLSTVYRNVAEFCNEGKAQVVESQQTENRYDANMHEHDHFICTCCGKIDDIERTENMNAALSDIKKGVQVKSVSIYGLCSDCKKL